MHETVALLLLAQHATWVILGLEMIPQHSALPCVEPEFDRFSSLLGASDTLGLGLGLFLLGRSAPHRPHTTDQH